MGYSVLNASKTSLVVLLSLLGLMTPSVTHSQTATSEPARISKSTGIEKSNSRTRFLRLEESEEGYPRSLQTAITRYRPGNGDTIIDLIGAVHIGEAEYYEKLNQQFELYDVVLYELVAPQGTRVPSGAKPNTSNPISFLQLSAQRMLGLESQLLKIDYQKDNLVHADMSPAEMSAKMKERGDTPLSIGISAFTEMLRNQNKLQRKMQSSSNPDSSFASASIFELMSDPRKMKLMMAQQFTNTDVLDTGLGSKLNQMLIDDRNAAALEVLKKQLDQVSGTYCDFLRGGSHARL